jgi:hypothetical protein
MQNYKTNAHSTIYLNCSKKTVKEDLQKAKWNYQDQVHSGQMVPVTARWEAGPREKQPKVPKN